MESLPVPQDCPTEASSSVNQRQDNETTSQMVPDHSKATGQDNERIDEIPRLENRSIQDSKVTGALGSSERLSQPVSELQEASRQSTVTKMADIRIKCPIEERLCSTIIQDGCDDSVEKSSNFVPISADIKNIGIEISDEEVKQLKNDIRRLSPVLVSLRERTLGEISLTSDAGFIEDQQQESSEKREPVKSNVDSEDCVSKREVLGSECVMDVSVTDQVQTCNIGNQKQLQIVLSRVDVSPCASRTKNTTEREFHELQPMYANYISPKYYENDQLSRKSPMVVLKRAEDCEEYKCNDQNNLSSLKKELFKDADDISEETENNHALMNDVETPSVANDAQESLDTETETETGSDNSELVTMTSVNIRNCEDTAADDPTCHDASTLACDEVTPTGMITRLEPERPEAFTEDSAESLALGATGAVDEVRSDGSDSGLGSELPGDPGPAPAPESDSETSFLDRIPDDILSDKEKVVNTLDGLVPVPSGSALPSSSTILPLTNFPAPQKSNLKRRLSDCMEGEPSAKRTNTGDEPVRKKRNIHFDAVTVYYFPRSQGFTCVPSQGGSTLGMSATHTHAERFSLTEHAAEQRRVHRARLAQLKAERALNCIAEAASSSEDPSDDTDEEPSDTEDLDIDSYYFLQPVPPWQRRALLRAAGVRRLDTIEKDDCRDIRASREHCGCGCKGYCDPESCPCSRANVKCQVDRAGFPCGCSRDGCANTSGRIEFNPVRVRTHFIHTLMRLELEKKQCDEEMAEREMSANNRVGPLREGVIGGLPSNSGLIEPCTPNPSCMNTGGFTTLHYEAHDVPSTSCPPLHSSREDSLDLYAIRDDCYPSEDAVDSAHNPSRKPSLHPEFNQAFQTFPGQQPTFQPTPYQEYQAYESLPSTSRPQFQQQFQSVTPTTAFTHYSPYPDPSTMQQASCHPVQHPSAPIYESTFSPEETPQQQYTNLNPIQPLSTSIVQQMGKLEPFSELLAGRYSYYGEIEPQPMSNYHGPSATKIVEEKVQSNEQVPENNEDCDENFGEIIKKSMVETVSA